jgi:hypothetical protein
MYSHLVVLAHVRLSACWIFLRELLLAIGSGTTHFSLEELNGLVREQLVDDGS